MGILYPTKAKHAVLNLAYSLPCCVTLTIISNLKKIHVVLLKILFKIILLAINDRA
jgi:hypothetical protein